MVPTTPRSSVGHRDDRHGVPAPSAALLLNPGEATAAVSPAPPQRPVYVGGDDGYLGLAVSTQPSTVVLVGCPRSLAAPRRAVSGLDCVVTLGYARCVPRPARRAGR